MKHVVAAQIDTAVQEVAGQPLTYKPGMVATRAISADITYTRDENEYYSDDVLSEADNSASGGDISIVGSEFLPEVREVIFALRKVTEGGQTIYRTTSVPAPKSWPVSAWSQAESSGASVEARIVISLPGCAPSQSPSSTTARRVLRPDAR